MNWDGITHSFILTYLRKIRFNVGLIYDGPIRNDLKNKFHMDMCFMTQSFFYYSYTYRIIIWI